MAISRAQTPKNVANPSLYSKAKAKAKEAEKAALS